MKIVKFLKNNVPSDKHKEKTQEKNETNGSCIPVGNNV